jgi:hypothetical protein
VPPYLVTVLFVGGMLAAMFAGLFLLEMRTLRDSTPDNHITAAFRLLLRHHGPLFYLVSVALSFCIGAIFGHIFHEW